MLEKMGKFWSQLWILFPKGQPVSFPIQLALSWSQMNVQYSAGKSVVLSFRAMLNGEMASVLRLCVFTSRQSRSTHDGSGLTMDLKLPRFKDTRQLSLTDCGAETQHSFHNECLSLIDTTT